MHARCMHLIGLVVGRRLRVKVVLPLKSLPIWVYVLVLFKVVLTCMVALQGSRTL